MVRQYKIHTNLDSPDNKVYDVTNGKLRFYAPSNLGIVISNNIWATNGIGVKGTSNLSHPDIEFQMETFGETLEENYQLVTDFVQDVLRQNFVTLEYTTDNFTVYADLALSEQTKTEGYGCNGTFSESITFNPITKWYKFDKLQVKTVENGEFNPAYSKIYATGKYVYSDEPSYTYFGESNVQRFSHWEIDKDIFSFVATIVPSNPAPSDMKFGLRFLDKDFNEYTAIVLQMQTVPTNIQFNTDVNDEYYNAVIGSNTVNQFPALDFSRFRTRQFQQGTMELIGVSEVNMSVKRKVDFI
jgi:hypothetical protein